MSNNPLLINSYEKDKYYRLTKRKNPSKFNAYMYNSINANNNTTTNGLFSI